MATAERITAKVFTKADNYYKEVGSSLAALASAITAYDNVNIAIKGGLAHKDKYTINLGGLFGSGAQASDRYINRRYNVYSELSSAPTTTPNGFYQNGFIRSTAYYPPTTPTAIPNSLIIKESMQGGSNTAQLNSACNAWTGNLLINFHTLPLEEYLNKAPFNTAQTFVTSITMKTAELPASGQRYVADVNEHTEVDKENFIAYCKSTYGEDCRVITGYDILNYDSRKVLQSVDGLASGSVATTKVFVDKVTRLPTVGWASGLNTTLQNASDVKSPASTSGYIQYAQWNNEYMYSELVFPLSCNATKLLAATSQGYQLFNNFFSLVYASAKETYPNYGHFHYVFQKSADYSAWAKDGFFSTGVAGKGVLGVWTLEQIDNYCKNCLGVAYTIDDLDKAQDGEPDNPPDDGEPSNPGDDDDDDGDGDNTDDPIKPNDEYEIGISTATAWVLSESQMQNVITPFFFGSAYLSDLNALFKTGLNPFTSVYGLYRYNMNLLTLGELQINQKEFRCMNIPIELTDGSNFTANYIGSASGMISLNDGFQITRYFGNFLDYEPYTKMTLYIPYCGYKEIPCNMVYGRTIKIKLAIDWLSGYCTAFVTATDDSGKEQIITSVQGSVGMQKVFCGVDDSISQRYLLKGILGGIAGLGAGLIGGAAGASGAISQSIKQGSNALLGSPVQDFAKAATTPPSLQINGQVAESLQGYAPQDCCMFIERTMPALPGLGNNNFQTQYDYIGKPAAYQGVVGEFSGFLSCSAIKGEINSPIITEEEKQMIYDQLRGGIYV